MKSAARGDREQRRAADVVVGAELAGLEDHLQVRLAAGLLHADDLVVDLRVAAGEEGAAVDHHVDLVGAVLDHPAHLVELRLERRLAGRERGRDRGDLDAAVAQALDRGRDHVRVDAERGDRRHARVRRVGSHGLRGERRDLARRVGALERRQVGHPHRELEREDLRLLLDAALRERGGALLERDLVDRPDPRQPRLERKLEAGRERGGLRHGAECSPGAAASRVAPGRRRGRCRGRRAASGCRPRGRCSRRRAVSPTSTVASAGQSPARARARSISSARDSLSQPNAPWPAGKNSRQAEPLEPRAGDRLRVPGQERETVAGLPRGARALPRRRGPRASRSCRLRARSSR